MSIRFRRLVKYGALEGGKWLLNEARSAGRARSGAANAPRRLAIISDRDAWCSEQQFNPFDEFRDELAARYGLSVSHIYLDALGRAPPIPLAWFDAALVKLSYRTPEARAVAVVKGLKRLLGERPLIYMDGDDDVCVQWGEVVAASDLYVKCHAFADRRRYLTRTLGKSNLHEYAIEAHGHVLGPADYSRPDQEPLVIQHSGMVAEEDLGKIVVGWNMAFATDIRALWRQMAEAPPLAKTIDCSFRGSVKTTTIAGYMRRDALACLERLAGEFDILLSAQHVSRQDYYTELAASRICVSPFGFGELCWRDFEAVLCRSLLIKPDMSHIETAPDIFQPFVTYVPVKWDLSDLEEKCRYYLEHEDERRAIAERAWDVLDGYYREGVVIDRIGELLATTGIRESDQAVTPCS